MSRGESAGETTVSSCGLRQRSSESMDESTIAATSAESSSEGVSNSEQSGDRSYATSSSGSAHTAEVAADVSVSSIAEADGRDYTRYTSREASEADTRIAEFCGDAAGVGEDSSDGVHGGEGAA